MMTRLGRSRSIAAKMRWIASPSFEVGRVQEALVLVGIENAFGRHQLQDLDARDEGPAVRSGAGAQLLLGFGEADINSDFAGFRAGHQELQGDCGFSGARGAFEQMQPVAGDPPFKDIVEAGNAGRGPRQDGFWRAHRKIPGDDPCAISGRRDLPQRKRRCSRP